MALPQRPAVIDLFAGVGGISLGASRAGFEVRAAVEIDGRAAASHAINFPLTKHVSKDVGFLKGKELLEDVGLAPNKLHGLVGGPPCQGFSSMGKNLEDDPRNALLIHFCRLVGETSPAFFLFENVPGLLRPRNRPVLDRGLELLPKRYRVLPPILLNANDYGAATSRSRVFVLGYDPNRVKPLEVEDFAPRPDLQTSRVKHALEGLPTVRSTWQEESQSWRAVEKPTGGYFRNRISGHIPIGVGCPDALRKYKQSSVVSGFLGTTHTAETIRRFSQLGAGEVDSISKARRLDPEGLCPTLRAGTGPERGSFQAVRPVHPRIARVICPREAARLQGFPDWFVFDHTKWHSFRQIGNSVSPLVAEFAMKAIRAAIGD